MTQVKYLTTTAFLDDEYLGTKTELFNDHVASREELVESYDLTNKEELERFLAFDTDVITLVRKMYTNSAYIVQAKLVDAYELLNQMEQEIDTFARANDLL